MQTIEPLLFKAAYLPAVFPPIPTLEIAKKLRRQQRMHDLTCNNSSRESVDRRGYLRNAKGTSSASPDAAASAAACRYPALCVEPCMPSIPGQATGPNGLSSIRPNMVNLLCAKSGPVTIRAMKFKNGCRLGQN
jgi:hypothetical protein